MGGPKVYKGQSPTWHLDRPSTAERMAELNAKSGFIAAGRTLTSVLRGFHYRGDRAEIRRGWHVSKEWRRKYVPELPWKKGSVPFDPRVDVKHLRKVKGEAAEKYHAAIADESDEEADSWQDFDEFAEDVPWDLDEAGTGQQLEGVLEGEAEEVDHEEVSTGEHEMEGDDDAEETMQEGTLNWAPPEPKNWRDVTGRRMLKCDTEGRLLNPEERPLTAKTFTSQDTDHQHDNLLTFLVDDRYFKGKEPMKSKRAITESILHKMPDKKSKKHKEKRTVDEFRPVSRAQGGRVTKEGGKRLSDEARRVEQNRILRQVTEEEFQRETERRMMLATIANPQKRLMLHRYFEGSEQSQQKRLRPLCWLRSTQC